MPRRAYPDQRGHMETGIVFAILAVLAAIALPRVWSGLPAWARVVAVVVVALFAVMWILSLRSPSGMAANARRQGLLDDRPDETEES